MHHVILRLGTEDRYEPVIAAGDIMVPLALERPGDPHSIRTNVGETLRGRGLVPPDATEDLFHLAVATYCADTRIPRSTAYDDWTRGIVLHLPVGVPELWQPLQGTVADMLGFLTGDHWELRFRAASPREADGPPLQIQAMLNPPTAVSLFSGGLDSFIGAVDRLEAGEPIALVSHYGIGTTSGAQARALAVLERHYGELPAAFGFFVQPPVLAGQEPERSTRSRSILFLALGALVAGGIGRRVPLLVPENGFISLNPPLTLARTGSPSTRTTHPHYIALFRKLLAGLNLPTEVEVPYRFDTKGRMARGVLNTAAFREGVHDTVSCSHPEVGRYQGLSPGQHCGYCVPCIIRRAALADAGLDDPAKYIRDVLRDPPPARSQAGRDLRAFQMAALRFDPDGRHKHLFEVLHTGPIPPEDVGKYVDVYRCGMQEIRRFLGIGTPVTA